MRSLFLVHALSLTLSQLAAQETSPAVGQSTGNVKSRHAETSIAEALEKEVDWEYSNESLSDVLKDLESRTGVTFLIDRKALSDIGIGSDAAVDFHAKSLSIRDGLNLALAPLDTTWVIRDDSVTITSPEDAESYLIQRVYKVPSGLDASQPGDFDELMHVVMSTIAPDTWAEVGGMGSIEPFAGVLVISQSEPNQERIAGLLRTLSELPTADSEEVKGINIDPRANALRPALDQPVTLDDFEVTLDDLALKLSLAAKINILIDRPALADIGLAGDSRVTVQAKSVPLKTVLSRVLRQLDLTWQLSDGVLMITSRESAESQLETRIYRLEGLGISLQHQGPRFDVDGLPQDVGNSTDALSNVIQSTVSPDSWAAAGGVGDMQFLHDQHLLVVSHVGEVHAQLEELLTQLRRAHRDRGDGSAAIKASESDLSADRFAPRTQLADSGQTQLQLVVHPLAKIKNGATAYSAEDLTRVIMKAIESDSWNKEKGVFIEPIGDAIAIRHTKAVQERIRKLLAYMKSASFAPNGPGGFF